MPQAAQAADDINVPDSNFKAVLNTAIASATGTTRAAGQAITPADALKVTSVENYDDPIADFTGVAAFTNLVSLSAYATAATISLDGFAGSSIQTLALVPAGAPDVVGTFSSNLSALGSMSNLNNLTLAGYSLPDAKLRTLPAIPTLEAFTAQYAGITDVAPLAKLTNLVSLDITENRIRNLSHIAEISGLRSLIVPQNLVSDIGFLSSMKVLTVLNMSDNLIENVTPLAQLTDKTKYKLNLGGQIDVSLNRIADLSPLSGFFGSGGPSVSSYEQSVYAGSYQTGGVPITLRTWRGTAPQLVSPTGAGTYDGIANRLVSTNPAAPSLDVGSTVGSSWTVYFSEAPDKLADLRINEVESSGDTVNGDWVEVYNPAATAVNLSGVVVSDSDNSHKLLIPKGTTIPANGYRAIVTEDASGAGAFGLGGGDQARLFLPGVTNLATATPIDSYTWTTHATTTYGRTVPGAGIWATTIDGTFGAENEFPPPVVIPTVTITGDATSSTGSSGLTATVTKPDSTDVALDATGKMVFSVDGSDVSGLIAVTNGIAQWSVHDLAGSPVGTKHQITARYVSAGEADPYDDSPASASFTVTVTILDFTGAITLSTRTPQVCETITSDLSGITPTPDTITYQWQDNSGPAQSPWANMSGETKASQTLKYGVSNGRLEAPTRARRLVATASKAGYATKVFISAETASIALAPFVTTPAATLSVSAPKVGDKISATHPEWTTCVQPELNWKVGYSYQWLRDGQPVTGATDAVTAGVGGAGPKQVSYTATPADAGHKMSLRVTGNSTAINNLAVSSAHTEAVAAGSFGSSPAPTIDNTSPKVGDNLAASTGAWTPTAAITYQWLRDGETITGATSATYTTTVADSDHALSVRATGMATGYETTEKTSAATAKVATLVFSSTPTPVISDSTPTVGDKLTATVAAWSPAASMSWQWLRDGQPIAGATSVSYTVTAADRGRVLSVRVTGKADGHQTVTKTSAATAKAAAKQVRRSVTSKYTVKVAAQKGKKLRLTVSARNVPTSTIDKKITVKIAGVKGSYSVTVKNGRATLTLGSKAKKQKAGSKVSVTVALPKLTSSTTSSTGATVTITTYTIAKAAKKLKVKLK